MADQIVRRADARAQGLTRYFTGKECKRGHISERYVSNLECAVCVLEKTRARQWHKANPEKHRENGRKWADANPGKIKRYREANRDKLNASHKKRWHSIPLEERKARKRAWYEANQDHAIAYSTKWAAENADRVKIWKQENYRANKERLTARNKRWVAENPERVKANMAVRKHRRRALEKAVDGTHTAADLIALFDAQKGRCAYCRADLRKAKRHLDHIMPLALGGSNDRSNLQYLCAGCNLSKGAKHPITFAQEMGHLL